jgi:lambda repressor-like predicted transcriptional regulator
MTQKTTLPDINTYVAVLLKQRGSSLRALSLKMGHNHNWLGTALKRKNLPIDLLLELSNTLGVNLLEAYLPHLEPLVRPTAMERDLIQKMNDQTAHLLRVTEERDRYWKVIEGRVG